MNLSLKALQTREISLHRLRQSSPLRTGLFPVGFLKVVARQLYIAPVLQVE